MAILRVYGERLAVPMDPGFESRTQRHRVLIPVAQLAHLKDAVWADPHAVFFPLAARSVYHRHEHAGFVFAIGNL